MTILEIKSTLSFKAIQRTHGAMILNGSTYFEGNAFMINSKKYLGPICDDTWGADTVTNLFLFIFFALNACFNLL